MAAAAEVPLRLGGGGVTGSRNVLIGDLSQARFDGSDLTPYVSKRITETVSISDPHAILEKLSSLTSGDFLFLGNAAEISESLTIKEELELFFSLADGITSAYENGAAVVLVYPSSFDVEVLNKILNISLAHPDEDAPVKAFELLGLARCQ